MIFDEKFDFPIVLFFESTPFKTHKSVGRTQKNQFLAILWSFEKLRKIDDFQEKSKAIALEKS